MRSIAASLGSFQSALNLDLSVTKSLDSRITFTRASSGTYFDASGVLQSALTDVARFDHDPTTLVSNGLLIEEARTNLLLQSADLYETGVGNLNWTYQGGDMAANTQVSPDSTTTADTLTTTGAAKSIYQSATVLASTSYTFTVYAKLGTMAAADYKIAVYNNTGASFIASDVVPSIVPNATSWSRVAYSFTTPVGCTSVRVYPFRNGSTIASSTLHLWGAQLEAGAFATSYIPTTTAAATRAADVASMTGTNFSSWFNASEGSFVWSGDFGNTVAAGFPRAFEVHDTTANESIRLQRNDASVNGRLSILDGGVSQVATDIGSVPSTAFSAVTISVAYKLNDFAASVMGGAVVTDTTGTMPTVTAINLGANFTLGNMLNGHISRLTYYPTRLSNSILQSLSL